MVDALYGKFKSIRTYFYVSCFPFTIFYIFMDIHNLICGCPYLSSRKYRIYLDLLFFYYFSLFNFFYFYIIYIQIKQLIRLLKSNNGYPKIDFACSKIMMNFGYP